MKPAGMLCFEELRCVVVRGAHTRIFALGAYFSMMSFFRVKTVKGKQYLYRQTSVRKGKKCAPSWSTSAHWAPLRLLLPPLDGLADLVAIDRLTSGPSSIRNYLTARCLIGTARPSTSSNGRTTSGRTGGKR